MVMGERVGPMDADALAAAYPWPASGQWVRAMMVMTLDGAARGADGLSKSISGPADARVFGEARRLADAVLVGAGTIRAERYQPMQARPADGPERRSLGLASAPVVVIVSGRLDLPWNEPLFSDSALTPIVVTSAAADVERLHQARRHANVIVMPGSEIEPVPLLAAMAERGLNRVVCEGGPRLLSAITAAGVLDEADISIAPMLVGGGQVATGSPFAAPATFTPVQVIADDGYLFVRYLRGDRQGAQADPP